MIPGWEYDVINQVPFSKKKGLADSNLYLVHTPQEWNAFFELMMTKKLVAADTETSGFEYYNGDRIVGMSFGWEKDHFYIPVRHVPSFTEGTQPPQLSMEDLKPDLQKFFARKDVFTIWHNCMHAGSKVLLADGSLMKIDKMVKEKHPGPVLTLNENTGEVEEKRVVNWLKGDLRLNEEWIRIQTSGKGHISCTSDHEIITERGRVCADEVCVGDNIATSLKEYTYVYRQFLLGTLLGDSSISLTGKSKSPYIRCSHVDESFASFKADLFGGRVKKVRNNRGYSSHKPDSYSIYKTRTSNDERLQQIYELVTILGKKALNKEWIKELGLPAIAMWYCDDGWLEGKKYPKIVLELDKCLETTLLDHLRFIGLSPSIWWRNDHIANITFQQTDMKLLAPFIPSCMERKLPEGLRGRYQQLSKDSGYVFYSTVTEVTPLFTKTGRKGITPRLKRAREYCIAVEGNKNFFVNAGGGLGVSNCKFDKHFYAREGIKISTPFHETTVEWHLYDENAPKALKVISSGWTDLMKQRHKGLFGPEAAAKEKELSEWRKEESKARRQHYKRLVMARADELRTDIAHQDKNRTQLKKWIEYNELAVHKDRVVLKDDIHYGYVPIELMTEYAAIDTFLTYHLHSKMMEKLNLTEDLIRVYTNEVKLSHTLFEAEELGALVDREYLTKLEEELTLECGLLTGNIKKQFGGTDVNLNSGPQLVDAFQKLGATLTKRTGKGEDKGKGKNLAMDADVLKSLAIEHSVAQDILDLRGSDKILNTYVRSLLRKTENSPYVHMNFNQNVTTGRMSCSEPNLQNIPRNDTRIRRAFICPDGYYFIFADYSQVEVRLTAHYSEDPIMLDAYSKDQDIHARTASEMFDVPYSEMMEVLADKDHEFYKKFENFRSVSKTINFGIIYGVGAPGLSNQIPRPERYKDVSEREWIEVCQQYINRYFEKYRGVKRFINRCTRQAKKHAEIPNYFGRVRHLPHIHARKIMGEEYSWMAGKAERQAANFVIQSTAADVFKFATVRVAEEVFKGTNSRIVNLVHDDIQSYVRKDELDLLNKQRDVMEDFDFLVPLKVDFAYSTTSWAEKKEL